MVALLGIRSATAALSPGQDIETASQTQTTLAMVVFTLPEARGQKYVLPGGAFFTLKGGRITRITTYYNLQDWIRQVSA